MKIMRQIRFWVLLAGFFLPTGTIGHAAEFVPGIVDLPLAPGLAAILDKTVEFDSPEGRIVDATAAGPVAQSTVIEFYRRTLPQLGWQAESSVIFRRGRELLKLEFSGKSTSHTQVRFSLRPQSGN